ncbi:MAG: L-fuconolactonase [Actinomycetota bacterium]|nr:L-fuconolactonase [Actinomycetota bacterium]
MIRSAMVRIDAHHHVWDLDVRDQPWTAGLPALRRSFDIDDLAPDLAAADIDATVVVQTITTPDETPELLAMAAASPLIAGVVGWVDLEARDIAHQIAALRELPGGGGLVGIRHQVQGEPDPDWLTRPSVLRGLSAVATAGLSYDLLVTPGQLPAAIGAARRVPGLRFILDHAGKPRIARGELEQWSALIASLAALPNVAAKLSGLATEASAPWSVSQLQPYVDVLLTSFGASRIMFGSDWPVSLLAAPYSETVAAAEHLLRGASNSDREAVFGATALEWYQLPLHPMESRP